jgi:hypothetical protein
MTVPDGSGPLGLSKSHYPPFRPFLPYLTKKPGQPRSKPNDFNQFDNAVERACHVLIVAKLAWTTFPVMETAVLRSKEALSVGDCIAIT